MTIPAEVLLPDDTERRQIFYTLKRWSSYTAWNRILRLYQAWADAIENSLREAGVRGLEAVTSLQESDHAAILAGLAQCDEGVSRLRLGDKRVFRCDFNGAFRTARCGALAHWGSLLGPDGRIAIGEIGIREDVTPGWADFARAGWALDQAWGECSPGIIEPNDRGEPTKVAPLPYGVWLQDALPRMTFIEPLPEVPEPAESVILRTGDAVPCSGIWEPVGKPHKKTFSLFTGLPPQGPLAVVGGMNFLHGGAAAPRAALETRSANVDVDAGWRLIWRDDRYIDGSIPLEEKSYAFLYPETPEGVPDTIAEIDSIIVLESGQRVPNAGRWLLQDSLSLSISLGAGECLPLHEGRSARWVLAHR